MSKLVHQEPLILASSSAIRLKLLSSIGLDFSVISSHCDEEALKKAHVSDNVVELGYILAQAKALDVSKDHPDQVVIAADQLCVVDKQILDKPLNHHTAIKHLQLLRGKQHQQISCLCLAKNGKIIWQYHDIAYLTLHDLSDSTIENYVQKEKPYHSCGAYHYETLGKWLFKEVQGKEDTILGLPLIPLMNALIELRIVQLDQILI